MILEETPDETWPSFSLPFFFRYSEVRESNKELFSYWTVAGARDDRISPNVAIESRGARVFWEQQAEPGIIRVTSDRYIV